MNGFDIAVFVLLGAAVIVQWICCLGLCLMRNPYDRLHAIAPAAILSPLFIAIAFVVQTGWSLASAKAFFIAAVLIGTQAVIVHALARAARQQQS